MKKHPSCPEACRCQDEDKMIQTANDASASVQEAVVGGPPASRVTLGAMIIRCTFGKDAWNIAIISYRSYHIF